MKYRFVFILFILALLQSCTSITHSYTSLLEEDATQPSIYMSVNDTQKVLAVSDGFPGWWGFYPTIISFSPEVASVSCEEERGLIPFLDPGVVFGGTVCYLTAHEVGETWIYFVNKYGAINLNTPELYDDKIKVLVTSSSSL